MRCAAGEAPLGMTGASAWHDQGIRSFDALLAPMLVDRNELQTAVLHSDIARGHARWPGGCGVDRYRDPARADQLPVGRRAATCWTSPTTRAAVFVGPPRPVAQRSIEALGRRPTHRRPPRQKPTAHR